MMTLCLNFLISVLSFLPLQSPFPYFKFNHYTVEEGLSVNTVTSIIQDSRGFMWFGTSMGLNCYDGRYFRNFIPQDPADSTMKINDVLSLAEGRKGELLVGTISGLYVFNPEKEEFFLFRSKTAEGVSIDTPVYCTVPSSDSTLWIGTYGQGVFKYNYRTKAFSQLVHNPSDSLSIPSDNIRHLFIDSRKNLWILTYDNGIGCISYDSGRCRRYSGLSRYQQDRFDVMAEDSEGRLWLGNYTNGLYMFDPETGAYISFPSSGSDVCPNHIRAILEYSPNVLLVASDDGLMILDTSTGQSEILKSSISDRSGLNDNYVHSLYVDTEGSLWVGTYFGGINYSPASADNFKHFCPSSDRRNFPGKVVSVITQDQNGDLWIGTDDSGVFRFNQQDGVKKQYVPTGKTNSLSYWNIHSILCDEDKVWIGTYSQGLDCLDLKTEQFRHYDLSDGLVDISIYSLCKDSRGNLWSGSPCGASVLESGSDSFSPVQETEGADIRCIKEDSRGFLWFASYNKGLFRFFPETGQWEHYSSDSDDGDMRLSTNIITTISAESSGSLFIGTDGYGLYEYDYSTSVFNEMDVPFLKTTNINSIVEHNANLWISTNKGLVRVDRRTKESKVFGTSDGLQSVQFSPNSSCRTDDGIIYFGGINGFNAFNPDELKENTSVPRVYITGLKLFNRYVTCSDSSGILDKALSYEKEITLRHNQSVISLEFVSLSYIAPDKNRYSYKLEGFDRDWCTFDVFPSSGVTYTNLSAGHYIFRVKASNNDMLWNNTGATLNITVLPPWWQTTLAYVIYILVILCSVICGIRLYIGRLERRHKENIRLINEKKRKEVYDIKINFYTNIIHELRTPLSLIISPLEYVIKSGKKVVDVMDDLMIIQRNSYRLLNLVNQLMDFRKIEAMPDAVPRLVAVNLPVIIRQIYERFISTAGYKGKDIVLNIADGDLWVQSNEEALNKIVSNLLSNAIKFASSNIVLTVKVADNRLVIVCEDDGPSVPEEEREKIFAPFYQVEANQPADGIGTGVGLSLVKSLVMQMEGEVYVGDSPMSGALFRVLLPYIPCEPEISDSAEINEDDTTLAKILVVDDNRDMLQFIRTQLEEYCRVSVCSNASEAIRLCQERSFDVIVSDVMMPDMDGFEFCRIIKENLETCHIPVILLTAKTDVKSKIKGLEGGADSYIEKPFSMDYLKAQINNLMTNRRKIYQAFAKEPVVNVSNLLNNKYDLDFIKKVDEYIDMNITEVSFTSSDIARYVGMSRSAFFGKLKAVSGQTPSDYVRLARLRKAIEYFNSGETRINEICYLTGFNSHSYFTKCFSQQFGETPKEYIRNIAIRQQQINEGSDQ